MTADLTSAVSCIDGVNLSGVFYRNIRLRPGRSPSNATGSIISGGRYNPKGAFEALYLNETPQGALQEVAHAFNRAGFAARTPSMIVAIDIGLQKVLTLTNPATRRRLGLTVAVLRNTDWRSEQIPVTQQVALLARDAGFEAIPAPSARFRGAANLVVFPDRLHTGSTLQMVNEENLPDSLR